MPEGFFHSSVLATSRQPLSLVPKCGACGLYKKCVSPKMPYSGKGGKKVLVVGEAPGENEDNDNLQFTGITGQYLENELLRVGLNMREDCWLDNALRCRPQNNQIDDEEMIDHCRPNIIKTIEDLKPEVILILGSVAVASLIGWLWKPDAEEDVGGISKWAGWRIPCQRINTWICPTYHPSFIVRNNKEKFEVPQMHFRKHLKAMTNCIGERPWSKVPDWKNQIKVITDADVACRYIKGFQESRLPIAFDYETTAKKPEYDGFEIICCSISDGDTSIAFPWYGSSVRAMATLLADSAVPKIASNLKFEDRATRHILGFPVEGWFWDTMNDAHILDNRPGITGLKFQSFALLGAESYDDHLKPLLRAKGNKRINQIASEIEITQLLIYCGLDSLLEVKVAKRQCKQMGMRWPGA